MCLVVADLCVVRLGAGGFGAVFVARDVRTGATYALKRMFMTNEEQSSALQREVELMARLPRHKNIIGYIDSAAEHREYLILMELSTGGSVFHLMNERGASRLRADEILAIYSDLCEAVAHLHSQRPPIAHRDLKVENVLLGADGHYKLCDFGSATTAVMLPVDARSRNLAEDDIAMFTTMAYRAPEMVDLFRGQRIDTQVDVWALGVTLYKMLFYTNPFEDTKLAIMNAHWSLPETARYPRGLYDLVGFCLQPDPYVRPDIFDLCERVFALRGLPCPVPRVERVPPPAGSAPPATASAAGGGSGGVFGLLHRHASVAGSDSAHAPPVTLRPQLTGDSAPTSARASAAVASPPAASSPFGPSTAPSSWAWPPTASQPSQPQPVVSALLADPWASAAAPAASLAWSSDPFSMTAAAPAPAAVPTIAALTTPPTPTSMPATGGHLDLFGRSSPLPTTGRPASVGSLDALLMTSRPASGGGSSSRPNSIGGLEALFGTPLSSPAVSAESPFATPFALAPHGTSAPQALPTQAPAWAQLSTAAQPASPARAPTRSLDAAVANAVNRATSDSLAPAPPQYPARLLALAWQSPDEFAAALWLALMARPLRDSPVVCSKALILLHRLLHCAPRAVLQASIARASALAELKRLWANDVRQTDVSRLCAAHADALGLKLALHARTEQLEGNYSLDAALLALQERGVRAAEGAPALLQQETVAELLRVYRSMLETLRLACDPSGPAAALKTACAVVLAEDVHLALLAGTCLLHATAVARGRQACIRLVQSFDALYAELTRAAERLRGAPGVADAITLPALASSPPAIPSEASALVFGPGTHDSAVAARIAALGGLAVGALLSPGPGAAGAAALVRPAVPASLYVSLDSPLGGASDDDEPAAGGAGAGADGRASAFASLPPAAVTESALSPGAATAATAAAWRGPAPNVDGLVAPVRRIALAPPGAPQSPLRL